MRLLIVTQAIDLDDPLLGFFHSWVERLAARFENVEVICLKEGRHALPANVRVHSLGKPAPRFFYIARFGWLIWRLRPKYDRVFVHMNPEYVILAGLDWRLMGKKIFFWYNHPHDDVRLRVATALAHAVFYTSPYAATAKLTKAIRMPAGIDTDLFKPQSVARNRHSLYMQGRIMPSKHVEEALAALRLLRKSVPDATLTLIGPEIDVGYAKKLRAEFADLVESKTVLFAGPRPNNETPVLYSAHGVSVNFADDGHYDKSVLESMACGTPAVFSSKAFAGFVLGQMYVPTRDDSGFRYVMGLSDPEYRALSVRVRTIVVEKESLDLLIEKLAEVFRAAMYTTK